MSQIASSSRLNNSSVNIIGATTAISTNFGLQRIGVTGNSFDISSSSGNVTLGATGTGNVELGNATSGTVSFPGTTTFATLNSPAAGTNMSVGGNLSSGTLNLGSTTSTTNLYGILDVARIEGPTAGSALTIGNNITSGSISIGSTGSNNTVNIGSVTAGPTGTVNVGTFSSNVNIGGVGTTAFIGGTVVIGATGSGNVAIGPNASSVTNIGNNNAAATTVNVGNTGTSAFGTVNVGRGATAVFIGDNVASAITLGRSTGSVTLGPPLTLGAAPTTNSGQLGYTTSTSLFFGSSFTGGNLPDNTGVLIPAPGVWLINYAVKLSTGNATGAINNFYTRISSPSAGYTTLSLGLSEISGAPQLNANTTVGITNNGSGILTVTNSTTYIYISVVLNVYAGPYTINNVSYLQFTRIA